MSSFTANPQKDTFNEKQNHNKQNKKLNNCFMLLRNKLTHKKLKV